MDNIMVEFSFPDDPAQKFRSAHFPAMPRVGDLVTTPQPHQRQYRIAAIGFQCEGPRADETYVLAELRVAEPTTG